jgi:hypothetical protein
MRTITTRDAIFAVLILLALSLADVYAVATEAIQKMATGYSSPQEAFSARRNAVDRRDWRTAFFTLTPQAQDAEILGLFDSCIFHQERNVTARAAMKKYGLAIDTVFAEYNKAYHQKYGVDLDKLQAEVDEYNKKNTKPLVDLPGLGTDVKLRGAQATNPRQPRPRITPAPTASSEPGQKSAPSLPDTDGDLLAKVVLRLVTDKAGFCEEAQEAITPKVRGRLAPDYGDLEAITVSRESATGWLTVTYYSLSAKGGLETRNSYHERVPVPFRKLNGRWYVGY